MGNVGISIVISDISLLKVWTRWSTGDWIDIPNLEETEIDYGERPFRFTRHVQSTSSIINSKLFVDAASLDHFIQSKLSSNNK